MPEIDFDNVAPLIASMQTSGGTVLVTFRCPVTAEPVQASAGIEAGGGLFQRARRPATQDTVRGLRSRLAASINSVSTDRGLGAMVAAETTMLGQARLPGNLGGCRM